MELVTFLLVSLGTLELSTAYVGLGTSFSVASQEALRGGSLALTNFVCKRCGGDDATFIYEGQNPLSCPKTRMLDFEALLSDPTSRATSKSNALTRAIHKLAQEEKDYDYTPEERAYGYGNGFYLVPLFCEPPSLRCEGLPCERWALTCDFSSKYRTIDGTCNNGAVWTWGAALTAIRRILPSAYHDHEQEPRGGNPSSLPNARKISLLVHPDRDVPHPDITLLLMQFGQFTDHDVSLMPIEEDETCCTSGGEDEECFSITVPEGDQHYSSIGVNCIKFARSSLCGKSFAGRREQFNEITVFIDSSNVYGSDTLTANELRTHVDGKLKSGTTPSGGEFLPANTLTGTIDGQFMAGDVRVNEQPGLTVMHALFLREHNRIAEIIRSSPDLPNDDETIYQETRRIMAAQRQKLVYQDWLPLVVGPEMWSYAFLDPQDDYYYIGVDPSVSSTFATAAFRFGHTLIQEFFQLSTGNLNLKDNFFDQRSPANAALHMERILSALTTQKAQSFDRFFTKAITNNLYFGSFDTNSTGAEFGADLIAFNIQRGRDHGIRNYNDVRCFCGMKRAGTTAPPEINPTTWQLLLQAYNGNPDDIELFPAMVSETPVPGGVVGKTMACIIAEQFKRIRYGDRFFFANHYEDCPEPNCGRGLLDHEKPFIRRRYLSHIICENSNIEAIQQDVFKPVSSSNPLVPCTQFPKFGVQEIEAFFRKCPSGWEFFADTSRCYFFDETLRTWGEARDNCSAIGGELTPIRNRQENDFIYNMTKSTVDYTYVWFGANDFRVEDEWEFLDGTEVVWTNFNTGQPEHTTAQQCLALRRDVNLWHDLHCDSWYNPSVCSRDAGNPGRD